MLNVKRETVVCENNAADVYRFFLMKLAEARKMYDVPQPIRSIKPLAVKYPWLHDRLDEATKLMGKEYIKHQNPKLVYFYYLDVDGDRVGTVNEERS